MHIINACRPQLNWMYKSSMLTVLISGYIMIAAWCGVSFGSYNFLLLEFLFLTIYLFYVSDSFEREKLRARFYKLKTLKSWKKIFAKRIPLGILVSRQRPESQEIELKFSNLIAQQIFQSDQSSEILQKTNHLTMLPDYVSFFDKLRHLDSEFEKQSSQSMQSSNPESYRS